MLGSVATDLGSRTSGLVMVTSVTQQRFGISHPGPLTWVVPGRREDLARYGLSGTRARALGSRLAVIWHASVT